MTRTLRIPYQSDLYEVMLRPVHGGHIAYRIIKYMGESQLMREVEFYSLPKELITKIEEAYHAKEIEPNGLPK